MVDFAGRVLGSAQFPASALATASFWLRWDQRSKDYTERRTKEGLSKKEIVCCLKRFVACEIFQFLTTTNAPAASLSRLTVAA
ncbi:hypothetical protein [Streptomyces sp. NPDC055912]|uniref:hypothetical protein n=1 Tax=Streptomyces sp. NPDC055912 TaxID=3345660 RepID=UPI0035E2E922